MYWTIEKEIIEPCIIKGNQIAIRLFFRFWLDKNDEGYEKTLKQTVSIKKGRENDDLILNSDLAYSKDKVKTPIHGHFIEVPIDSSIDFIKNIGNQLLSIVKKYHELKYFESGEAIVITNTMCNYILYDERNSLIAKENINKIIKNL